MNGWAWLDQQQSKTKQSKSHLLTLDIDLNSKLNTGILLAQNNNNI